MDRPVGPPSMVKKGAVVIMIRNGAGQSSVAEQALIVRRMMAMGQERTSARLNRRLQNEHVNYIINIVDAAALQLSLNLRFDHFRPEGHPAHAR